MSISQTAASEGQRGDPAPGWSRSRRLLLFALPPVAAFVLALALDYAAYVHGRFPYPFFSPTPWFHFDTRLYLQIAAKGYRMHHCGRWTLDPPHSYCGNAGWLPLYPRLIRLAGRLGMPLTWAGLCLADLFAFGMLLLTWVLIGPSWSAPRLLALAFAAVFPGQIYYFAIFPVSLAAFLSLAFLLLLVRRRYALAGLSAALAAWTYPVGFLLAPVALLYTVIADRGRSFARWLDRVVPSVGIPVIAIVGLALAYQIRVHAWNAYLLVQAKYGNGFHDPVSSFLISIFGGPPARYPIQSLNLGYTYLAPKLQTILVAALVLALLAAGVTVWRESMTKADWAVLCFTVIVWLFPLTQSVAVSRYRSEALLIPCAALVRRLPVAVQVPLVIAAGGIAFGMALLFYQNKLI